ncbi:hypothetical protein Ahy_B01g055672 [Arachis hypogaea]|uniref:Transposase MuDR plant domain-containing protein n=1 Tax=Arachis hypogaea TaxID=3818 RepID=A0A445AWR2_ARAHY|nr:hypothetical protein Ahy_B01g055672 [Arachis hypogaea]
MTSDWSFTQGSPEDDPRNEFKVGQHFRNKEEVMLAVKTYSIRRAVEYKIIYSDQWRYNAQYIQFGPGCNWSIHISYRRKVEKLARAEDLGQAVECSSGPSVRHTLQWRTTRWRDHQHVVDGMLTEEETCASGRMVVPAMTVSRYLATRHYPPSSSQGPVSSHQTCPACPRWASSPYAIRDHLG